jgi:hypothetical protein
MIYRFCFRNINPQIKAVIERMVDLAIPFQKRWFYHHLFSCSFSIKQVLPVIAPDLSYKNLTVNNGDDASVLFMKMMIEPNKDWTTERKHLLRLLCIRYVCDGSNCKVSSHFGLI